MHKIEVNNIKVFSNHGCMEEESLIGGEYIVDVHLYLDFTLAAENDDLNATVDYVRVNEIVVEQMNIRSKLIEHVGLRIHNALKNEFELCEKIYVKVTKVAPPINGDVDNVAIIIED